jgi:hypothetical protein
MGVSPLAALRDPEIWYNIGIMRASDRWRNYEFEKLLSVAEGKELGAMLVALLRAIRYQVSG